MPDRFVAAMCDFSRVLSVLSPGLQAIAGLHDLILLGSWQLHGAFFASLNVRDQWHNIRFTGRVYNHCHTIFIGRCLCVLRCLGLVERVVLRCFGVDGIESDDVFVDSGLILVRRVAAEGGLSCSSFGYLSS